MNDKHFIDWENATFGFGYGTGELHTLAVLKGFFINVNEIGSYDYKIVCERLGSQQFWLILNTLCHADIIEYGTSPRYGWLTEKGEILREYIDGKTVDKLYELTTGNEFPGYVHCYPDHCNCDVNCENPLFAR